MDGAIYYCAHGIGQVRRIKSNANAPMVNVVSGDLQVGTQGQQLALPMRVQVTTQGVPQAGVQVTFSPNVGTVGPQPVITDANGFAETNYTLDPTASTNPTITVSAPNGIPATFSAVWRGLVFTYIPAANLAIVSMRHSQTNSPISIGFDVPAPSPVAVLPWGSLWVDFLTPSPTFGVLPDASFTSVIDGLGLFGPPTGHSTGPTSPIYTQTYLGLPSFGGVTLGFQGFAVDTSLLPAATAIVISGRVVITLL